MDKDYERINKNQIQRDCRFYRRVIKRIAVLGILWFSPWNKDGLPEKQDELRTCLLIGVALGKYMKRHPEWFIIGEWDYTREAHPIKLTRAGRKAALYGRYKKRKSRDKNDNNKRNGV